MNYTADQTDALTEIVNIGIGRAAASLSELIGARIELAVPEVALVSFADLPPAITRELDTSIVQDFEGQTSGRAVLAFPEASALKLGQILADLDEAPTELDFDLQDVLNEVGNIVLNGVLGSLSNVANCSLRYSVPTLSTATSFAELAKSHLGEVTPEQPVLVADARFDVAERNISGSLLLLFQAGGIEQLTRSILEDVR